MSGTEIRVCDIPVCVFHLSLRDLFADRHNSDSHLLLLLFHQLLILPIKFTWLLSTLRAAAAGGAQVFFSQL